MVKLERSFEAGTCIKLINEGRQELDYQSKQKKINPRIGTKFSTNFSLIISEFVYCYIADGGSQDSSVCIGTGYDLDGRGI
jgi:hypothetical protein